VHVTIRQPIKFNIHNTPSLHSYNECYDNTLNAQLLLLTKTHMHFRIKSI